MVLKDIKGQKIYSDGEIEDALIEALEMGKDVFSIPYKGGAVFHNFTDARENIINWYPFIEKSSVLEIGAGMGALTGVLCDRCEHVTAFEQSSKRAQIIEQRYKNKNNLEVICGDIFEYEFSQKFDYILMIGVLEYVGVNNNKVNPYKIILDKINKLLTPNGILLLAIENQFGLKYWCGSAEDHTGIPFDGIAGYKSKGFTQRYNSDGVRTFSRESLKKLLLASEFYSQRWYYPLPDYKFPMSVFSDEYLPRKSDIEAIKFVFPIESELIADEKKLYDEIIDNNVFPFFANSFLIEARREELQNNYIKCAFFKRDYKRKYEIATMITNKKEVIKRCMNEESIPHMIRYTNNMKELKAQRIPVIETEERDGESVQQWQELPRADYVFNQYLKEGKWKAVTSLIDQLEMYIKNSSDIYYATSCFVAGIMDLRFEEKQAILLNGYIDMTFVNSFFDGNKMLFFDQEWKYQDIPIKYVLYRAVRYAYRQENMFMLEDIYRYIGIDKRMRDQFQEMEKGLLEGMMDERKCNIFDPGMYHEGLTLEYKQKQLETNYEQEKNKNIDLENENINLENKNIDLENKILDLENRNQEEITRKNEEIGQKEQEIGRKKQELEQKEQEIGQRDRMLAELNERYEAVMHSIGWRMVSFPGKVYEKCFPVESLGRKRIKMASKYVGAVNLTNIKFVGDAFKKGGIRQVRKELNAFEYRVKGIAEIPLDAPQTEKIPQIKDISKCKKLVFRKSEKPVVSIIIPVYNQFEYTYACLKSILKNSGRVKYEIIIADDVSNDLTKQIEEVVENIRVIRNKRNLNFLRNCNHAARHANGEYILFLNNDTQVQENWLRPLVELMESDEMVGMVGSKLIYPDGRLQEAGGIIWGDGHAWNFGNGQNPENPEFNYVKEVDYISGASIMIRASLWKQIGGFDDRFAPAYCEDSDLAFEVRKHGYKLMYQPLSVVVHFEGKSNGTDTAAGIKKYQVINNRKFAEKWKEELKQQSPTEDDLFYARDRSQGKKTILVIDHYVPQYDKDAGSKTTWQYLKMFVERGYNVKFIGDNFYQHEPYTTQLQQMGIEVLYGAWYANHYKQWIMDHKNEIDFAYLNRPHITLKYIDFLKSETNIKCIYYGHDLHFLRIRREYELSGDKKFLEESKEWKETELSIMHKADMSYYPSCVEVEEIQNIDPSINVKAITAYVYDKFMDGLSVDFSKREGILFVGGFGHPPNEDAVLWFVEEVYPLICAQQCIPFYIVGSNATERVKKIKRDGVILKGFVTEEELTNLYNSCKLVVVPLRYGAGVKGKVVEALYNGTPMVSTSVGIEGINGADQLIEVADAAGQFADKVLALYNDNAKLKQTVSDYQDYVKKNHSIDAVWNIIKDDFQ